MFRISVTFLTFSGLLALPLLDATAKGAVVLTLAGLACLWLRRDSAAARHCVLTVAVALLLIMPLLSYALPRWQVLPAWLAPTAMLSETSASSDARLAMGLPDRSVPRADTAMTAGWPDEFPSPLSPVRAPGNDASTVTTDGATETVRRPAMAASSGGYAASSHNHESLARLLRALPLFWAAGVMCLLARLAFGALSLRRAQLRCSDGTALLGDELSRAKNLLGLRRSVRLFLAPDKSIPIAYGLFRQRLRLPAEAIRWPKEQLRSVLLHELAHLRRHDLWELVLTQIACAIHWFNPLVWIAARRLHVERERACDDLVLASGVRPSSYAEHLLEIATKFANTQGANVCGLAMARKSSLEGRLLAVLSHKLNRRGTTLAWLITVMVLGVIIATPIAMLHALADSPADSPVAAEQTETPAKTNAKDETGALEKAAANGKTNSKDTVNAPSQPATLTPAIEAQLDWGEPVDGLRGALIIRSPGQGKPEGIYLVLQNVSDAPIRFVDEIKSDRLRTLYLSDTQGILAGLSTDEPTTTDVTLQPRAVAFLSMMRSDTQAVIPAGLIEGIRKDSLQTWFAVLRTKEARADAWKGELRTGATRCAVREALPQPKNKDAQALFKVWQDSARLNGDIPGGLVRLLHEKVQEFIRNNEPDASGGPYATKMKPLESRFANAGDWKAEDVVALLDDIAAAHTIPLETTLWHLREHALQPGTPLPESLANADWGEPLPSGLRVAHRLEPRSGAYHLGAEVKARILFHNAGAQPVAFITTTFQQPKHSAKRADGGELRLDATEWLTRGRMVAYRLAPGEYCEVHTPGLGIGASVQGREAWEDVRAGSWILCAEGDEVVFTPGAAALSYHRAPKQSGDWWLDFITERLNRETPVPTDKKEREYLLYRVVRELYGAAPSTTEGDAFAADQSPVALKNLALLLAKHPYGKRSEGMIQAGSSKFRVRPPDSDADIRPRVATGPGSYTLGEGLRFYVTRRPIGNTVVNEASILHYPQGQDAVIHKVELPSGHDTWIAAMMKGATELWIAEVGTLRKYDFANPLKVVENRYDGSGVREAPLSKELRAVLDPVLSKPTASAPKTNPPSTPATDKPATDKPAAKATSKSTQAAAKLTPENLLGAWRGTVNDKKLTLSFHRPPVETSVQLDIYEGDATIGLPARFTIEKNGASALVVLDHADSTSYGTLRPGAAGSLQLELHNRQQGQTDVTLTRDAELPVTEPRQKEARELFKMWQTTANADGTIPGTFVGKLATEVRAYVKANPTLDSAAKLPKLLPRFVTSRDWTQAEAVELLDDVAYYSVTPIAARVAKAKLSNSPLWRTEVEYQDIPVQIAKWSEAQGGLRIGLRVVGGQWRAGEKVRAELWLHNASAKDVSFTTVGPNRQDHEVTFTAIDSAGQEHWPVRGPLNLIAEPLDCTLPAGHVAMAKQFDVTFADADNDLRPGMGQSFRDLKPGKYQLRCSWFAGKLKPANPDDHIELTAPDFGFTLDKAKNEAADANPPPQTGAAIERVKNSPREWKVRVVDGSTGKEPVGVTVVAWVFPQAGGQGRRREHRTDGNGWTIELADNEHATLMCEDQRWVGGGGNFHIGNLPADPTRESNATGEREGARHTDPDKPFELRIWRGAAVAGQVRLPGGKPAAGVHVMLGARIDSPEWIQRLGVTNMNQFSFDHGEHSNWHSNAVTNERGEFTGAMPPSEACTFTTLACRTKDALPYEEKWDKGQPSIKLDPTQAGDGKVIIQLEAGVRVYGRVVDTDGKPAIRAQVYATGQHRHENTGILTGAEGQFELRARPGVSQISVDIRERNEKGEVTSHHATGIHAPENVEIPAGVTEFVRDFRIMRLTDAGPVLPPEGKPRRESAAAVSFANYGKPSAEFTWVEGPWGPATDGLSMALELDTNRADQWRAGGSVQGELYVRNNRASAVTFPQHFAMHVGLSVTARDKNGKDHPARITMWEGCPALHHLTLPPGHTARVKLFSLAIDAPDAPSRTSGGWLTLAPGQYKLRARWSDAHAMWAHDGEWTGALESGEVDFTVAGASSRYLNTSE